VGEKGYDAEHNHALCRQELGIRSTAIPLNPRNSPGPPKGRYRLMMHDRFPNGNIVIAPKPKAASPDTSVDSVAHLLPGANRISSTNS
jgi:hypothetical protein